MSAPVRYWVAAAREQNRLRVELRRQARNERRCRESGALYDAAFRCRDRRDAFMEEARRVRAALARCTGGET